MRSGLAGRVRELWRYPVKSLVGERLPSLEIDARGVVGDRLWSVRDEDGKFGSGKTTRRFRRMDGLLELAASQDGETPLITFPDGSVLHGSDAAARLSAHVGRPVALGRETDVSHFDEGPVHVLTTASIAAIGDIEPRRLRMNILVEVDDQGFVEDDWIGRELAVGDEVVLSMRVGMTRCLMVDLPQIGLPRRFDVLRAITARHDSKLGLVADVVRGGVVRVGDEVR